MDRAVKEVEAVEIAVSEAHEAQSRELYDLQLAIAGGGCGDPILF
jgi:hypothetical protein